jgi:hypothetical protein
LGELFWCLSYSLHTNFCSTQTMTSDPNTKYWRSIIAPPTTPPNPWAVRPYSASFPAASPVQPLSQKPSPRRRKPNLLQSYLAIGGTLLALMGLILSPRDLLSARAPSEPCQEIVQPQSKLTREQISQLLTIPERSAKDKVKAVISTPYCKFPQLEVRAGIMAEREAYPLAFDPQTWLVILYEGNEYAGYAFSFRH